MKRFLDIKAREVSKDVVQRMKDGKIPRSKLSKCASAEPVSIATKGKKTSAAVRGQG